MTTETTATRNEQLIELIKKTATDTSYLYETPRLYDEKIRFLAENCQRVLDFGKSSRERSTFFAPGQIVTSDLNQYDGYPDIVDDICDIRKLEWGRFDGIVCLSILEHVYAPHLACENLHRLLKPGGYVLVYVPYIWQYHAPRDLSYQDYFRFSRDALAYLFKDFSDVTIYPVRGRYSTIFNMLGFWKGSVERRFRQSVNRAVDRVFGILLRDREPVLQASGYCLWARK